MASVFYDLYPKRTAAKYERMAIMLMKLQRKIKRYRWTNQRVMTRFGISAGRADDLIKGRFSQFTEKELKAWSK